MRKKICFVVTIPQPAIWFLRGHIAKLSREHDVYLVSSSSNENEISVLSLAGYHTIAIRRKISLVDDVLSVYTLYKYFKTMHFDAVHSLTPKAGLIAAIAGRLAGVPSRIHIFTGQVWATRSGMTKWLLKLMDKIVVRLDTHILIDGLGQREYLMAENILTPSKSLVLGSGSICGVDTARFTPDPDVRRKIRETLHIGEQTIVYAFLGRLNKEKGISELLTAYNEIAETSKSVFLLLIGMDDDGYGSQFSEYPNLRPRENFYYYGLTAEPYNILQAADIFVFPSYREGFGSSVIEASCLGIPVICSSIYGLKDTMVDNVTGLRCEIKDPGSLKQCMNMLKDNQALRLQLGQAGRKRVLENFSEERVSALWMSFYNSILE